MTTLTFFWLFLIAALVAMFFVRFGSSGTEIGFDADEPNPNHYEETLALGWPATWLVWAHEENEAQGLDARGVKEFLPLRLAGFVALLLLAFVPLILLRRKRHSDT